MVLVEGTCLPVIALFAIKPLPRSGIKRAHFGPGLKRGNGGNDINDVNDHFRKETFPSFPLFPSFPRFRPAGYMSKTGK